MALIGLRVYGAQKFAFSTDEDGMINLWVDADHAPSTAVVQEPEGLPWAVKLMLVHGSISADEVEKLGT